MALGDVRDALLPVAAILRQIADAPLGMRPYTVYVRRIRASDSRGGRGTTDVVTDTLLVEKPAIRQATEDDIVEGGGRVQAADMIMEQVTPRSADGSVGVDTSAIAGSPTTSDEQVFIVLDGPDMPPYVAGPPPSGGGEFTVASSDPTGLFEFKFVLRPRTGKR